MSYWTVKITVFKESALINYIVAGIDLCHNFSLITESIITLRLPI